MPTKPDILFVFEAPNGPDTFDPEKGYLTYETDTDPSGNFFRELVTEILNEPIATVAVTNSVLCLPLKKGGKHSVTKSMLKACNANLVLQIMVLEPAIVAPMGAVALQAARLIHDHRLTRMSDAVARGIPWFGRTLFPLYHTGLSAQNGPSGRNAELQRKDWALLRDLLARVRGERSIPPMSPAP